VRNHLHLRPNLLTSKENLKSLILELVDFKRSICKVYMTRYITITYCNDIFQRVAE
jgi:hypothetical protein